VTSPRPRARAARQQHLLCLALASVSAFVLGTAASPRRAAAEKVIANVDGFQFFTDGRVGGFFSNVYGDGYPQPTYGNPVDGGPAVIYRTPTGGGFRSVTEQGPLDDPGLNMLPSTTPNQGTINVMRVRSGFVANVLGFGVRTAVTDYTSITGYIQYWTFVESSGRQKNYPNYVDARQGYAKLEGPWGSFLAGRTRALFSRGATDIDALYGHRWGVGFPGTGAIDSNGPTLGQIGFGVLGSGFAAGLIYGTPNIAGFQLNVGLFDPIQLQGNGGWNRTKVGRPEFELTYEHKLGEASKIVFFGNGAYQKVYKDGYCVPSSDPNMPTPCSATAKGVGYGGRFEVGPVHLGLAGHYGYGLGLNYALEASDAAQDKAGNLRKFDGYYGQLQVVLGKFDLSAGYGIARVFLTDLDRTPDQDPRDPNNMDAKVIKFSVIKYQAGANAGIVYNVKPNVHFDVDVFRAQAVWYYGEQQILYVANAGMILNW